jgi:hypothetical protein
METCSLHIHRPHLEGVLGPLSEANDAFIRNLFGEADGALLRLAEHFGRNRAGWEGTGLELSTYPHGQLSIGSNVEGFLDKSSCVAFCIELRPSWCHGLRSPVLTWEIELNIDADCDGPSMITVYGFCQKATSAVEAATVLRAAAFELLALGTGKTLEHWLHLASVANTLTMEGKAAKDQSL